MDLYFWVFYDPSNVTSLWLCSSFFASVMLMKHSVCTVVLTFIRAALSS